MSQISVSKLTFAYDGSYDNIFEDVNFQIDTDWKLGFIGRNGRGKTTFMKLLMNMYEYRGTITSSVTFDYFPFHVYDETQNTIDVVGNIDNSFEFWQLERELSLLEVTQDVLYRPFDSLSNGEQTKILLATLFLKDNNFLLIDEPTNHLDMDARRILSDYLKTKKGFILVSHDREFVDNCIDHILSINKTNIDIQSGNFTSWWNNKKNQDNYEVAMNKKLEGDIKKLENAAKRTSAWSDRVEKSKLGTGPVDRGYIGHKAAKMAKRSKSIEARRQNTIEEKSKLLRNIESSERLKIEQLTYHANILVSLSSVSISYGENMVCKNVSFVIERGDRIALYGKNGCGKSSIIKLICGEDIPYSGELKVGSGLKISYVSQNTSFLNGKLSDFAKENCIDESLFKSILRKLDFSREQFEKDISDFSGGQKKKVLIAKSLCEKAHLYIWDEPLNFIDVISRMQIENLLLEFNPTILFVEHDKKFCDNISTKRIALNRGDNLINKNVE